MLAGPFGMRGGRDRFFRNNGDGTFRDATEEAGMTDTAESYGLGVLASDLDFDGDVDVFVANDSNPNFLYRNNGNGTFTEVGAWSGAGLNGTGVAQAGMGVDSADFDGDGRLDILVTTFAKDSATLYRNEAELLFQDVSPGIGLKSISYDVLKWGCAFLTSTTIPITTSSSSMGTSIRRSTGPRAQRVVSSAALRCCGTTVAA